MNHFSAEDWADMARGLLHEDRRISIRQHLDERCSRCEFDLRFWRTVTTTAEREQDYRPPTSVVRSVMVLFTSENWKTTEGRVTWARLVFDSLAEPLPAGLRSLGRRVRQLLYEADDYHVDLKVERQSGNWALVFGQILRARGKGALDQEVPVALMKGRDAAADTLTNRHGEFRFEVDWTQDHIVSIAIDEHHLVECPLTSDSTAPHNGDVRETTAED